jgi:hypothetical protein
MDIRITTPELIVRQDKPFLLAPPEASNTNPRPSNSRPEQSSNLERSKDVGDRVTPAQEVIQKEVIVFSSLKHGDGSIVTGWKYPNGSGTVPSSQFCYYSSPNADKSSKRIEQRSAEKMSMVARMSYGRFSLCVAVIVGWEPLAGISKTPFRAGEQAKRRLRFAKVVAHVLRPARDYEARSGPATRRMLASATDMAAALSWYDIAEVCVSASIAA